LKLTVLFLVAFGRCTSMRTGCQRADVVVQAASACASYQLRGDHYPVVTAFSLLYSEGKFLQGYSSALLDRTLRLSMR
jgi:hypothetical protein